MFNEVTDKAIISLIATSSLKIKTLPIKNGQLIFLTDTGRIVLDCNDTRTFYNQITTLEKDSERIALENPLSGYYFVIDKAEFWFYQDEWIQITKQPRDIFFIDTELPELGRARSLYVDKNNREISIWDEENNSYIAVSNYTDDVTKEDINSLFNLYS